MPCRGTRLRHTRRLTRRARCEGEARGARKIQRPRGCVPFPSGARACPCMTHMTSAPLIDATRARDTWTTGFGVTRVIHADLLGLAVSFRPTIKVSADTKAAEASGVGLALRREAARLKVLREPFHRSGVLAGVVGPGFPRGDIASLVVSHASASRVPLRLSMRRRRPRLRGRRRWRASRRRAARGRAPAIAGSRRSSRRGCPAIRRAARRRGSCRVRAGGIVTSNGTSGSGGGSPRRRCAGRACGCRRSPA